MPVHTCAPLPGSTTNLCLQARLKAVMDFATLFKRVKSKTPLGAVRRSHVRMALDPSGLAPSETVQHVWSQFVLPALGPTRPYIKSYSWTQLPDFEDFSIWGVSDDG